MPLSSVRPRVHSKVGSGTLSEKVGSRKQCGRGWVLARSEREREGGLAGSDREGGIGRWGTCFSLPNSLDKNPDGERRNTPFNTPPGLLTHVAIVVWNSRGGRERAMGGSPSWREIEMRACSSGVAIITASNTPVSHRCSVGVKHQPRIKLFSRWELRFEAVCNAWASAARTEKLPERVGQRSPWRPHLSVSWICYGVLSRANK